jgi:uncharacterized protein (DUF58 family)
MLGRWFRRARRLRTTREGKYFIAITIGVGLAAMNASNNLLFLLLGWMCSVIIASGVLSELSLRGISVTRQPPPRIFAGRPFLMGIGLRNDKQRLPSFSIEIEDLVVSGTPPGPRPLDKKCYFLKIPARRTQSTSYRHTFPRRGRYSFEGFRVATKFPFALFRKSRDVDAPGEVIVYPAVYPVVAPQPSGAMGGEDARARLGRRGEFFGLRELRHGDDVRDVHWRKAAHLGRLMVREYEEEAQRKATVFIDNALPAGAGTAESDALERAISHAASLASAYVGRGYAVKLVARGALVAAGQGPAHLSRILRALALLETVTEAVPFAAAVEPAAENLLVARRGAAPRLANARLVEAP